MSTQWLASQEPPGGLAMPDYQPGDPAGGQGPTDGLNPTVSPLSWEEMAHAVPPVRAAA